MEVATSQAVASKVNRLLKERKGGRGGGRG